MKKLVTLALVVALGLSAAAAVGCGGSSASTTPKTSAK